MIDSVKTFTEEGQGFIDRNPGLNKTQQAFGGVLFASMRALAECPKCPGHFRIPMDEDGTPNAFGSWTYLVCPNCQTMWTSKPVEEPSIPAKPKSRKKKFT